MTPEEALKVSAAVHRGRTKIACETLRSYLHIGQDGFAAVDYLEAEVKRLQKILANQQPLLQVVLEWQAGELTDTELLYELNEWTVAGETHDNNSN